MDLLDLLRSLPGQPEVNIHWNTSEIKCLSTSPSAVTQGIQPNNLIGQFRSFCFGLDAVRPESRFGMSFATTFNMANFSPWDSSSIHRQPQLSVIMFTSPIFISPLPDQSFCETPKTARPFKITQKHVRAPTVFPVPVGTPACSQVNVSCYLHVLLCWHLWMPPLS